MAIVISGNGIDMGGNPVSNASQVDSTVINENGDNVATTNNLVGFKNYIINGGFDVWQRGTSYDPSTARYGAADRWWSYANSAGVLISQQTINTNGKYDLKIETNSSSIVDIRQGIECVTGKQLSKATQYTLSFVASFPVGSNVIVSIGYADNMSFVNGKFLAQDQIIGTGTGGYETYTVTVNNAVPNSTNTMLIVAIGGGSFSSSHYISNVQLEEGSVATPFENRPYGLELSLCERYFKSSREYIGSGTYNGSVTVSSVFGTTMRVTPTLSNSNSTPDFGTIGVFYPSKYSLIFTGTGNGQGQLSLGTALDAEL